MATVEQLRSLDWKYLLAESRSTSCDDLRRTVMAWLAKGSLVPDAANVWREVEPVLSLFIELDIDAESPFHPRAQLDALNPELIRNWAIVVEEVGSNDLIARVLDLAWQMRVCTHDRVTTGVQSYITSANERLDPSRWIHAYTRLKRAIGLGSAVGRLAQFEAAVAAIESVLASVGADDPLYLTHRLMSLLLFYRVGDALTYANLAHEIALRARQRYERDGVGNGGECERERAYLDLVIRWRRRLKDEASVRAMNIEVADAFVRQADGVIMAGWPAAKSVAVHFIDGAIKRLRDIGGEVERVEALRLRHQRLQREAVGEMRSIEASTDISEPVRVARLHVAGRIPLDAVFRLATAHAPPTIVQLEEEVRLSTQDTPFRALIPQSFLGPRGTILAEHAGIVAGDDRTGLVLETMRVAAARQSEVALIYLHAAAQQILLEHGLDTSWFMALASNSSFVPLGRESSFARGLAAGMRGDYELATVFLTPQFEHALRELFFAEGIVTSTLPSSGIQNEINLNQILEHPRAVEIFGEAGLFDLRVLLTEKAGANLRNVVAHGLVADGESMGAKIYFWWLCLRFVLLPLVNQATSSVAAPLENETVPTD